ncbi:MAG: penicillin-binding protein 2 [Bacilli bacterium]
MKTIHKSPYINNDYRKYKNIKAIIEKRYNILIGIIIFVIVVLFINLFYVQIIKNEFYTQKINQLNEKNIEGDSAPRGRIYDRNHRLIVDNEPVKVIIYKKQSNITTKQEINLAYEISNFLTIDFQNITIEELKKFWLKKNPDKGNEKITKKELKKQKERKITKEEIEDLKLSRITSDEINAFTDIDKEAATIYGLMNEGYSYTEKIIKKDNVTDEEYAVISENISKLKGINTKLDWERSYPYNDVFKGILGAVSTSESGIPYELKEYYLNKGYQLNDRVGVSYLEYQYEDILRGEKNVYQLTDGNYKLVKPGSRGNDVVLTIDIELQKAIEDILTAELIKTKNEPNTELYNRSFVVITNPKTGEILAMTGKQIIKDQNSYKIYDYTPGISTSPVVVGSIVKGASHIVGYNTGALTIGEKRRDTCIKIAGTPLKCSWKYLGTLNDITALKQSSNTYQFNTAIKVGEGNYSYNAPLTINLDAFKTYRNTFAEFGLGVKTGIDLPIESLGFKGQSEITGHLLDFSIGQYDTYTPIQLAQYIGTIASGGNRMQPYLLKSVYDSKNNALTSLISETKPIVLNKVNTKPEYMLRVQEGFKAVLEYGGTGSGYIDLIYQPAGKTGTSESFVDTDNDKMIDTETVSNTFAGYAPYNDPKVAFTVISPDVYHYGNNSEYTSPVNKRISQQVSKKFFEIYQ